MFIMPASGVNGSGTVVPAQLLFQNGTALLPSISFASDPSTGIYRVGASDVGISAGGTLRFDVSTTGATLANTMTFGWTDVVLNRDGANILALVNGVNPQEIRSYNTFTDASNYERILMSWNDTSNQFNIRTQAAGSGTVRALGLGVGGLATATQWLINTSGNFVDQGIHTITAGSTVAASNGNATIAGAQNKLVQITGSTTTIGVELNVGTPALGTCTGGTLVSGGKNSVFEVTGNTSGSCIVNFGTPIWQNAPLCFVNDESALIAVRISARSTNSITVTGAGSGDAFQVYCLGRVGT